jgi:hypothetical protein
MTNWMGIIKTILDWLLSFIDTHRYHAKRVQAQVEIAFILNELMWGTRASRVVLLKAHNGGKVMKTHSSQYTSVVFEVVSDAPPIFHVWQHQRIDTWFNTFLARMVQEEIVYLESVDLVGPLADNYAAHGIQSSFMSLIHTDRKELFYLSVNFKKPTDLSHLERERIRAAGNKIRRCLT